MDWRAAGPSSARYFEPRCALRARAGSIRNSAQRTDLPGRIFRRHLVRVRWSAAALDRARYFRTRADPARDHGEPTTFPGFCRGLIRLLLGNGREPQKGDRELGIGIRPPN